MDRLRVVPADRDVPGTHGRHGVLLRCRHPGVVDEHQAAGVND